MVLPKLKQLNPKYYLGTIVFLFLLFTIPLTVYLTFNSRDPRSKAAGENLLASSGSEPSFNSNELLIKVKKFSRGKVHEGKPEDTGLASLNKINKDLGIKKFEKVAKIGKNSKKDAEIFGWYKVSFEGMGEKIKGKLEDLGKEIKPTSSPQLERLLDLKNRYSRSPDIEIAEPNYTATILAVPNDPYYSSTGSWGNSFPDLYGIKKINPEGAWDQTTGSANIVVADIDTGVDRNHADIKDSMWVNAAEIPNNGIDDDANGFKDDYYGWDWVGNDNDPMDEHGHGTHTVGTIAGKGNNGIGVVGVNWTSRVIALRFLDANGFGSLDNGARALQYAADMGARVSSNSWGCGCYVQMLEDALNYSHEKGMVTVVAAGNDSIDALNFSPAASDHAITVAASNSNDAHSCYSNLGEKIDVAAPGGDSASCGGVVGDNVLSAKSSITTMCTAVKNNIVGSSYCRVSGTSMATPHVAGLAALLLSKNPNLNNEEVRQLLRSGSDDLGTSGKDKDFGYGRINASKTITLANTKPLTPVITSPRSRSIIFGSSQIMGKVSGPNFSNYKVEIGAGDAPATWTTVINGTTQVINGSLGSFNSALYADGLYIIRLTVTDTSGKIYQYQVHRVEFDNVDAILTSPNFVRGDTVDILGSAFAKNGSVLKNYKLEWAPLNSTSWVTTGITLLNSGTQPVSQGKLGTWDTSSLTDKAQYTLKLTVNLSSGTSVTTTRNVLVSKNLLQGWPITLSSGYGTDTFVAKTDPVVADFNGDRKMEMAFADCHLLTNPGVPFGNLYVVDYQGKTLPGWPVKSDRSCFSDPRIVDLDKDGKLEIITNDTTTVYVFGFDGKAKTGWPKSNFVNTSFSGRLVHTTTPAIGDLNNDGFQEILVKNDREIFAFRYDGSFLTGFPIDKGEGGQCVAFEPLVLADLDGDKKLEIVHTSCSEKIFVFGSAGQILPGWPKTMSDIYQISSFTAKFSTELPVVGELDKNFPGLEIAAIYASKNTRDAFYLHIYHKDGTPVGNSPYKLMKPISSEQSAIDSNPILVDSDSDGNLEIVFVWDSLLQVKTNGSIIPSGASVRVYDDSSPALYDINNDGKLDAFVNLGSFTINGVFISPTAVNLPASGSLGQSRLWDDSIYNKSWVSSHESPLVVDLDGDGKLDVVSSDFYTGSYYVFTTGFNVTSSRPWTTIFGDTQNNRLNNAATDTTKTGDLNGDGAVNVLDLSYLLSKWGSIDTKADINHDGVVNVLDLSTLLANWG